MLYFPCVFVESCWSTCFVLGLSGVLFCLGVRSSCVPTGYHGSTRRTVVVVGDLFSKVSSRFFSGFAVSDDIDFKWRKIAMVHALNFLRLFSTNKKLEVLK